MKLKMPDSATVTAAVGVAIILAVCLIIIVVATWRHVDAPTPIESESSDFAVRSLRFKTAPAASERVYIVDFDHGGYSYSVAMSDGGGMVVLDKTKK